MRMTRHRRKREHRRKSRALMLLTAAVASAAAIAGGAAYAGIGNDAGPGTPAQARIPATVPLAPAAAPTRDKEPEPIVGKPANDTRRGMVYNGLKAAPRGDRCTGTYRTDAGLCTHGPDAPPKGVDIKANVPPAVTTKATAADPAKPTSGDAGSGKGAGSPQDAPAADADGARTGAAAAPKPTAPSAGQTVAAGPAGQTVQCDGDGSTGNRVQVVYVHGPGRDRYAEYVASFRKWAADADLIYSMSAKDTGGVRHIRYVTAADCTPTVLNIELPSSALSEFSATNNALADKGLNRRDRKYMIFADTNVYCGIGTFAGDERPGQNNQSNFGPSYGRTDAGCWAVTPRHTNWDTTSARSTTVRPTPVAARTARTSTTSCATRTPRTTRRCGMCAPTERPRTSWIAITTTTSTPIPRPAAIWPRTGTSPTTSS
ncbi:Ricin B lectin [Streptomyces venezuelae]|nr:Ricin B lectin [Streptomyces venezuelae]